MFRQSATKHWIRTPFLLFVGMMLILPRTAATAKDPSSDVLFGLDKIWTIHLKFTAEQWKAIEPAGGFGGPGGPGGFGGPGGPPPFMRDRNASDRNVQPATGGEPRQMRRGGPGGPGMGRPGGPFGEIEYPVVSADFEFEGTVIQNVGIRYKGQASFMMSRNTDKKSFKVDFDKNVKGQKFFGLAKINLNNNWMDPSMMVDALSYETFREFGIAAPRTAFAKVYLTVEGEKDREYLGLYTMVEQIDEPFLERNFPKKNGLLLKPQMVQGFPYFGRNWEDYEKPYEPKNEDVTWKQAKRFMDFAQLVNEATDTVFVKEVGTYTDVDQFLRFLAVNVAIANYDSILGMGQNYLIYGEPEHKKYLWIPWDLGLAFGKFMMVASPAQQMQAAIRHPNASKQPLIERILAVPEWQEKYLGYIREFLEKDFQPERIRRNIQTVHATIEEAVKEDPNASYEQYLKSVSDDPIEVSENAESFPPRGGERGGRGGFRGGPPMFGSGFSLASWTEGRVESLKKQLAGESEGIQIAMRGGPGGGPGRGRGPGGPDGQGGPGSPGGPMMMPFGGPDGPGGPGGFGPGMFLGPLVLEALDGDKDGKASKTECSEKWSQWASEWDKNANQLLNEEELSNGLNQVIQPPEGFPPFGPPPGMFFLNPLMEKADANGELKSSDFLRTGEEWFKAWDANASDDLDNEEFAKGLNGIIGPPPGFGDGPPDVMDGPPGF